MTDQWGRTIDYLRVSVTDRCNLRCRYCMPRGVELCSHSDTLRYEELLRVCAVAVALGVTRFKILSLIHISSLVISPKFWGTIYCLPISMLLRTRDTQRDVYKRQIYGMSIINSGSKPAAMTPLGTLILP